MICYRKKNEKKIEIMIINLKTWYEMNKLKNLKWFLEIHILQDKIKKLLWFLQEFYINKLANQFCVDLTEKNNQFHIDLTDKLSIILMTEKLYSNDEKVSNVFIYVYQQKTDFILFAMIIIRSDVTFTVFQLIRFNTNLRNIHHKIADWMIQYLYDTKKKILRYENEDNEAHSFICVSDVLFADNIMNHKSFQNYIMMLFRNAITWKISK